MQSGKANVLHTRQRAGKYIEVMMYGQLALCDRNLARAEDGTVYASREVKRRVQTDCIAVLRTQKAVSEVLQGYARDLDAIEDERFDPHGTGSVNGGNLSGNRDVVLTEE